MDIGGGSKYRTKRADGFVSPIAAKIDPDILGEHQRAMQIAYDCG